MDKIIARKKIWCGELKAISRTIDGDKVYILQGNSGISSKLLTEKIFDSLKELTFVFNNLTGY